MLGFPATSMEFEYLASVYVGDTITCTVTMTEKDKARRLIHGTAGYVNQDGPACSAPASAASRAWCGWRAETLDSRSTRSATGFAGRSSE